ncbi:MAG TPA: DUF6188 family protein [Gaiellaceae bacterium]|nr:DUF6188 family protein [Gaiellaceae bacterium]
MTRGVVQEVAGEFLVPVEGFVCSYLQNEDELILRAPDSSDEAWLWASRLDAGTIQLLVMHEARVKRAVAARDATLRVEFDDGFSLVNPPEADVEAWELRGPGYVLLVGTPGGGQPAVWDETSDIRLVDPNVDSLPAQVVQMLESWPSMPKLAGAFQFRPTARGREAIELHAPDAPRTNRKEIIRFVLADSLSASGPYMRYTN